VGILGGPGGHGTCKTPSWIWLDLGYDVTEAIVTEAWNHGEL
jgi:hypothetical protein